MKLKILIGVLILTLGMSMFVACEKDPEDNKTVTEETDGDDDDVQVYEQDFHITNNTGVTIYKFFVSPSDEEKWGPDLLGETRIADGSGGTVRFKPEVTAQYWDIMVKDIDDVGIYFYGLDLFEISEVTLTIEDGEGVAEVY